KERRPPTGARGKLDDLAADGQPVEPAAGRVELRVPGRVVDRPVAVAPAAEIPVVVLGRPGLVIGDQFRRLVGRCRALRDCRPSAAARGERVADPEPQELVLAGLPDAVGTELGPALEIVGAAGCPGGPAPEAGEGAAERHRKGSR